MDLATYAVEAAAEETHWWFVGRRRLFARLIERLGLPRWIEALDIGTSTGTNLRLLRELGFRHVTGLDNSEAAIRFCHEKGFGPVRQGDACHLPFADGQFGLVLATDVIEHVDDEAALRELARVLAPGGYGLITVPAFRSLWGLQDEVAQHRRRYRLGPLLAKLRAAGLDPVQRFHFNFLLFLPIWLARRIIRAAGIRLDSENQVNTPLLNRLLGSIFAADIRLAPVLRPPFGVSILVLVRKPLP